MGDQDLRREVEYLRHWLRLSDEALKAYVRNQGHVGQLPDSERAAAYRTAVAVISRAEFGDAR